MLEVLGIRVGVEDEDASSDEDEGWIARPGNLALQMGPGSRRYAGQNGRGLGSGGRFEESELDLNSPAGSPYLAPTMKMPVRNTRPSFGNHASRSGFTNSDDESEDDQPLPSADIDISDPDPSGAAGGGGEGMVFRDGQWFTALDERYLLPLFSNSVTARRSMAKKGARKASVYMGEGSQGGTPRGGSLELNREEEGDLESENGKNKVQRTFR